MAKNTHKRAIIVLSKITNPTEFLFKIAEQTPSAIVKAGVVLLKVNFEEDWVPEIRDICMKGEKIKAIKRLKELVPSFDLKEAKKIVETRFAKELHDAGYRQPSL